MQFLSVNFQVCSFRITTDIQPITDFSPSLELLLPTASCNDALFELVTHPVHSYTTLSTYLHKRMWRGFNCYDLGGQVTRPGQWMGKWGSLIPYIMDSSVLTIEDVTALSGYKNLSPVTRDKIKFIRDTCAWS
jgi:hypothetical protein